jgi:Ca2+-binding RTX toxin-like protein
VRRSIALVLPGLLVLLLATPARATVDATFALGVLTVTGDADDDSISVTCTAGDVQVNGSSPAGGPVGCAEVETILVRAGGGDDRVTLAEVGGGDFRRLAAIGVFGEDGNDTLIGSDLPDRLDGGGGTDELRGGGGGDRLIPSGGGGSAIGGEGRDRVVIGGNGDWTINDEHVVRITPFTEETLLQSVELASVTGGSGDNAISASTFSGSVVLDGGPGDDVLQSGRGADDIFGRGGDDWLDSGAGNDLLDGEGGRDILRGGEGNDQLRGGPGDDTCVGGPGADSELSC